MSTHLLRDADTVLNRALNFAVMEQQRGDAGLVDQLPRLLADVTEEQVRAAAASLSPSRRALIEVIPGGAA
jgi:predicted Zn-dependent peptidase